MRAGEASRAEGRRGQHAGEVGADGSLAVGPCDVEVGEGLRVGEAGEEGGDAGEGEVDWHF